MTLKMGLYCLDIIYIRKHLADTVVVNDITHIYIHISFLWGVVGWCDGPG